MKGAAPAMVINKEELLSLMQDFYNFTHIRIVVLDEEFAEVATYPNRMSSFCKELRVDEQAQKKCKECDYNACLEAKRKKSCHIYKCHAGLTEAVSPIMVEEKIVGYIMLGQILEVESVEQSWNSIKDYIYGFDLDKERVKRLYLEKQNYSRSRIVSAAKIMEACAAYLLLSKMIVFNDNSAAKELDTYIRNNMAKDLSVDKICRDLNISRVKLYSISESAYGTSVAEHIRKTRVDAAQKMLAKSEEKIGKIADKCGFYDYNYFTKVFKKYVGMTPRDYRKQYTVESGF